MYSSGYVFLGEDRPPIALKSPARPGLDQPPPALGEGDLESDMSTGGVPGMAGSKPEPRPLRPDVAPWDSLSFSSRSSCSGGGCCRDAEERRLCCEEVLVGLDAVVVVEDRGASLSLCV